MLAYAVILPVLTLTPPIVERHGDAAGVPRIARPHTEVISVDRAAVERFAADGGGLLAMPLGKTRIADLDLRPVEGFAPDARIESMSIDRKGRLIASPVALRGAFLAGRIAGEADSFAFLAVSDAGTFGYVETTERTYIISSGPAGRGLPTVSYDLTSMPAGLIETPAWTCATPAPAEAPQWSADHGEGGVAGVQPCRQVRVAFDTDAEFLQLFGGNTTAATGYAATLAAALTSIYQRDLEVRVSGTFLRLWQTTADPWTAANTSAQLDQFQSYWNANMGFLTRDLAHFLSGRGLGGGVAYLPGLCNGAPYGVSANLAGFFPTPIVDNNGQNWDIMVVAHELGHNFGAPHTHDYAPPLDGCGSSPQDCTVANQDAGTIMSYCHLCSGGLQNIKLQFHPATIATIENHLSSVPCNYTGPARPPIALTDRVDITSTVASDIDVIANEIAFNCEALALELPQSVTSNGAQLSISAGSGPGGRDQIRYMQPNGAFSGSDPFTYQVRDPSGLTATASVLPTVSAARVPENPIGAQPGISGAYYALVAPSVLPDFTALSPYLTAVADTVNFASTSGAFAASGRADDVGAVFSGWVDIPQGGIWTFFTNSDDGSRLKIGSSTVVNNDGLHGMVEASGSIALAAGRHAIRIEFFERGGGAGLIASWQGPGTAKAVIPAARLLFGGIDTPADINNDGAVNGSDLALLLNAWATAGGASDVNRDGTVDGSDLSIVLNAWTG